MAHHNEHHHEHIEQLSADLLDQISGGATDNENLMAELYIKAAKHDGVPLDEAIALIIKNSDRDDLLKAGIDLDEVIKVMKDQW